MNNINKILTTVIFILTLLVQSYAQENYSTYENTDEGKTYQIKISSKERDKFTFWVDAMYLGKERKNVGIMINESQLQGFLTALQQAKSKYEEWVKVAVENDIKDFEKPIKATGIVDCYFQSEVWYYQYGVNLRYAFKIYENRGKLRYALVISTDRLISSSNDLMSADGLQIVFYSAREIDEFASKISTNPGINGTIRNSNVSELFKD